MHKLHNNFIETLNFINLLEDKKLFLYSFFSRELKTILNKLKKKIHLEDNLLSLYSNDYFFKFPYTNNKSKFIKNTPNISLFIPAEIYNIQTNQITKFDLFICNFPIILDNNSYLIDGTPKIINQQLIFDPGFLINEKLKPTEIVIYDANQENLLYIYLDDNNQLCFKYTKKTLSKNKILATFNLNNYLKESTKVIEHKHETSIHEKIILFSDFIKNFKITSQTRHKLNKKFNLTVPQNLLHLTEIDLKNIENTLRNIKTKARNNIDIDDLENKSISDINYYYYNLLNKNVDLMNIYLSNEENNLSALLLKKINKNSISAQIDEIFSNSEISIVLDQINPLSELSQQKKVLNLKRQEGNKNVPIEIRNIHPSIFGRLCIIDTPEGESAGLINSLTTLSLVNKYGLIETPIQYIRNNQIVITEKIKFTTFETDKLHNISFSINFNNIYSQNFYKNVKKDKKLSKTTTPNVNRKFLSYLQMFSIACSNIPFLEHNDGNRMLMGANMQKQTVPLLFPENTFVGSGLEDIIAYSTSSIKSLSDGYILYSDNKKLIVKTTNNYILTYFLDKVKKTFNETIINHTNDHLWCGDVIKFGQILANGFSIKNSELALGTNLTVAYMNWDGLNFEDAIIINEKLVKQDKLTSLHSKSLILEVESNEEILHIENKKIINNNNNLNKFALIKIGSTITKGDTLLIKKQIDTNDIILIESEFDGIITNVEIQDSLSTEFDAEQIDANIKIIQIDILQIRKIKVGDKLSGRFGNKGVISKIVSEIDMPFLLDGTAVDILINPLGIPSRMNIGQIFETLLGFVGSTLNTKYKILPFDESFGKNATKILINQKIKEKKLKTKQSYDNYVEDKMFIVDGRTGEIMDNPVLIGRSYILKLYHLVDDKITSRTLGPNSSITNQPVKGKKAGGGQRFGEMEVWAIEAYGASYTLNEMLNLKSDEVLIGNQLLNVLDKDSIFDDINYSKTLFIFDLDLKCLGFELSMSIFNLNTDSIQITDPISLYKEKDLIMNSNLTLEKLYDNRAK